MATLLIEDILKLNISTQSIKKIDQFLTTLPKYENDYMKALAYKGIIMHKLKKTNEALKLLFTYVSDIKNMQMPGIIALCDGLIYILIDINKYQEALKYISLKKDFLPVSKNSLYHKDIINLYIHEDKIEDAKKELEIYIKDDISKDEKMDAINMLMDIYYKLNEYDSYINLSSQLISYLKSNFRYKEIAKIEKNLLHIKFIKKDYVDYIALSNNAINDYEDADDILDIATDLVYSYLELYDIRRASIVIASYSSMALENTSIASKNFSLAAISLYDKLQNEVAKQVYIKNIEEIDNLLNNKSDTKTTKKKEEYYIPKIEIKGVERKKDVNLISDIKLNIEKEDKTPEVITKVKEKVVNFKNVIVSPFYKKISEVLNIINSIDFDVKFREYFRKSMVSISKEFGFDEAYLLYFDGSYKGFYYKLERVYDKYPKKEELDDTIALYAYENNLVSFFDETNKEHSKKINNPNEVYENEFLFSIPLSGEIDSIGSLTFISYTSILDKELTYEALLLFTKIINNTLNLYLDKYRDLEINYKNNFIINHMPYGLKEEIDGHINLSYEASNILGVIRDLDVSDYYSHIDNKDLMNLKKIKEDLHLDLEHFKEVIYSFNNSKRIIRIKEIMYPIMIDNTYHILSILEDVTSYQDNKEKLLNLAYKDPISKTDTELKLLIDVTKIISSHQFSIAVIKIADFDIYKYLYGYNFESQLIYLLAIYLEEEIKIYFNAHLYHLSKDNYAILFIDENDRRTISNKIKDILNNIKNKLYKKNTRLNVDFICGIYRSLKSENIKDPNDAITKAKDALIIAQENDEYPKIDFYDGDKAKLKFQDDSLITHISESIDMNLLSLIYKQIVDIKNMEVLAYFVDINLDNYEVSQEKISEVIKRRKLEKKVTNYIINNVFKEEKLFYNKTKAYLNIFIDLDLNNIDNTFISFMKKNLSFYKIKPEYVTFIMADSNNQVARNLVKLGFMIASKDMLDIYRNNIKYFVIDFKKDKNILSEINEVCSKKDIKLIIAGIDLIDDLNYIKENDYQYIYGNYYKKINRMKDIIKKVE